MSVSVNIKGPGTFYGLIKQLEFSNFTGGFVSGSELFPWTPLIDKLVFGWTGSFLRRSDSFTNLDFTMSPLGRAVVFSFDFDGVESIEGNRIVSGGTEFG